MKKKFYTILLTLLIVSSHSLRAQNKAGVDSSFRLFMSSGIVLSDDQTSGTIGFQFILKNNWGGKISYRSGSSDSKNLPADYNPGYHESWFLFFPLYYYETDPNPTDEVSSVNFEITRKFPSGTKLVRFGFTSGISLLTFNTIEFTPRSRVSQSGSNYILSESETNTIGLSLGVSLELPLFRLLGFEYGLYTNINPENSFVGFDLLFTLGKVRDRIHKK